LTEHYCEYIIDGESTLWGKLARFLFKGGAREQFFHCGGWWVCAQHYDELEAAFAAKRAEANHISENSGNARYM
jgi:hypothetical protein